MKKMIYVLEFHEKKSDHEIPLGYFKTFNEAKKVSSTIDTAKYTWSITERKLGKIDVMEDYRVAFSFDYMAGDILVKAGELFSVHGAKISCADMRKMAVKQDFSCRDISNMMVKQNFACRNIGNVTVNKNNVCRNTGNIVKNRGGVARKKRG